MDIVEPSTIHQRLSALVDYFCKGNKTAFGRETDILPGVLASITGGRLSKPSFELLQKIMTRYPTVSGDWLLLGRGPMLLKDDSSSELGIVALPYEAQPAYPEQAQSIVDLVRREIAEQMSQKQPLSLVYKQLNDEMARSRADDILALEAEAGRIWAIIESYGDAQVAEVSKLTNRLETLERAISLMHNMQPTADDLAPSVSYRIDGKADYSKPFDGLLARRLDVSEDEARKLVLNNEIGSFEIEGAGHEISEYMVRRYLAYRK